MSDINTEIPVQSTRTIRQTVATPEFYAFASEIREHRRFVEREQLELADKRAMEEIHAAAVVIELKEIADKRNLEQDIAAFFFENQLQSFHADQTSSGEDVIAVDEAVLETTTTHWIDAPNAIGQVWHNNAVWPAVGHRVAQPEDEELARGFAVRQSVWNGKSFEVFCMDDGGV